MIVKWFIQVCVEDLQDPEQLLWVVASFKVSETSRCLDVSLKPELQFNFLPFQIWYIHHLRLLYFLIFIHKFYLVQLWFKILNDFCDFRGIEVTNNDPFFDGLAEKCCRSVQKFILLYLWQLLAYNVKGQAFLK